MSYDLFFSSNNHCSQIGNSWPSLGSLRRHGPFDVCSFHVTFGSNNYSRIVLEHDSLSTDASNCVLLPDYYGAESLLSKLRWTALYHNCNVVAHRSCWDSFQSAVISCHVYDAKSFCSGVIGAVYYGSYRNSSRNVKFELGDSFC